jgi:hypothetical protein
MERALTCKINSIAVMKEGSLAARLQAQGKLFK